MTQAASRGLPVVLLASVEAELNGKLDEITAVIPALRAAFGGLPPTPAIPNLRDVEALMVRAKATSPERVVRYLDAIEAEAVRVARSNPGATATQVTSAVLGFAVSLTVAVRARVDSLRLRRSAPPGLPSGEAITEIPGVTGNDLGHVRSCEALGRQEDAMVYFVVFEARLHSRQGEIAKAYPHVFVTNPLYLSTHIDDRENPG